MVLPPQDPEISFGRFLKELPEDYHALAYEFKAFAALSVQGGRCGGGRPWL
jgi:hypothetical protein